ncbi:uncharacterized protein L199_007586 [Kwoniella botswanensis]|uniref:uncharacterized protein n=1 Tax=Kwoniella botswanensis TaxID=1268659 RepID=UPI00315DEA2B
MNQQQPSSNGSTYASTLTTRPGELSLTETEIYESFNQPDVIEAAMKRINAMADQLTDDGETVDALASDLGLCSPFSSQVDSQQSNTKGH